MIQPFSLNIKHEEKKNVIINYRYSIMFYMQFFKNNLNLTVEEFFALEN